MTDASPAYPCIMSRTRGATSVPMSSMLFIKTEIVGQDCLFDDVAKDLGLWFERPVRREGHVAECIEAEFERVCHQPSSLSRPRRCLCRASAGAPGASPVVRTSASAES